MDIRPLTDTYAVAPQLLPEEMAAAREAGYTTIICNRPDAEVSPEVCAEAMRVAAEAAGLTFVINPVISGAITMDNVTLQGETLRDATGPVLAYCASGNRSSVVWALAHAGKHPTDELIAVPARFGYNLEPFRPTIDQLAQQNA